MIPELVAASFVTLTALDGREVTINPEYVTSLAEPKADDHLFTAKAHCVVSTVDRKFISVKESCDEVRQLMEGPYHGEGR